MSWAEEILKAILMRKNINFKRTNNTVYTSSDGRIADEENQIVKCVKCNFVAPMSISYEEYQCLHREYNTIIEPYCCFATVVKK
ncbi:ac56 [Erannis ankeraria nucleopolyhedrovirus]|uniref:ac56 n=1 Tax=Erannis ankeraria nucleopolyhedrovirus TaxID=2913600 RepID=UPI00117B949E|nr:ac56 [Erannis ankeraria nucleopolyhedrovirus]UJZ89047.1 ac56 [Erannis ankeraria nucleopolyhedrovirus]